MLAVSGNVLAAEVVARANPDLQLIVDHLGLAQPHGTQALAADPFAGLDELLSLAKYPNIAPKLSGAPTLSAEAYPYEDLWPHLHRVLEAFGPERVMWGSDFSRTRQRHSYAEALDFLRDSEELTTSERDLLLGATARRLLGWPA
jgi:L-fuconolactonase